MKLTISPMEPLESRLVEAFLISLTQVESLEKEVQTQLKTLSLPANIRQLDEIIKKSTTLSEPYKNARQKLNDAATKRNKGLPPTANEAEENRTLEKNNLSVEEDEDQLLPIANTVLQSDNLVEAAKNSPAILEMAIVMSPI